jgi:NAD(P)-dependent dehydrogenase (short-subunit alcohol dehydrogenase family)
LALVALSLAIFVALSHQMQATSLSAVRAEFATLSLTGRRALVVGGTAGIGEGIALRLAQANVAVVVVGRDQTRGDAVIARLRSASSVADVKAQHRFVQLDASLIAECRRFARSFAEPLDFLVMTQGIATMDGFQPTAEGFDRKLSLHYFSRATLALELAPKLSQSADGRVLTVLSAGVHSPYAEYATDFDLSKAFSLSKNANAAGFYNDVLAEKLHVEFPRLTVAHAAPGFVKTNWGWDLPWYLRGPTRLIQHFATSIEDCGALLAPSLFRGAPMKGAWHLLSPKCATVSKTSLHDSAKDEVWAKTKALIASVSDK